MEYLGLGLALGFFLFIEYACYQARKQSREDGLNSYREFQKKWEKQKAYEAYKRSPEYEAILKKNREEEKKLKARSRYMREHPEEVREIIKRKNKKGDNK